MAISLETFRAFAGQGLSARTKVNLGDEAKTTLSATRYAGGRPLAARTIVAQEEAQDNIYVRSQLLSAVRDALGGEGDAYFRQLEAKLLGISEATPQADAALAAKPLALRDVRAALEGLDARLAQKRVAADFAARVDADFGAAGLSPRSLEVVRSVLLPQMQLAQAANPRVALAALTGPGSAFAALMAFVTGPSASMRIPLLAQALPPREAAPFLRACALIAPRPPQGVDVRLHAVADRLASLKAFTPENVFKLAYPGAAWPKGLAKGVPLSEAARKALVDDGANRGVLAALRKACKADDAAQMQAAFRRLCSLAQMLDHGMRVDDALKVLDAPAAFQADMLPPMATLAGVQKPAFGVAEAFEQSVKDIGRCQISVSIERRPQAWQLSSAARLDGHPFQEMALQDYRAQVEALCGPQASESMKANIFLFISQNGQALDGFFNQTLGLGSDACANCHYRLSAQRDGSVVVSREAEGPQRYNVLASIRFFPDGRQRLERPLKVRIHPEVPAARIQDYQDNRRTQDLRAANNDLNSYVRERYAAPFADLFEEEIAALMRTYPAAGQTREQYRMRACNMVGVYFSEHADAAAAFMACSEEGRRALLVEATAACLSRTRVNMASLAIRQQCLAEAAAAVRAAAGAAPDAPIALDRLIEKISYCRLTDETTVADIERQYRVLKEAFVKERADVFAFIREEAARSPEAMPADLRDALLLEARERPRLARDGLEAALALARALVAQPLPDAAQGPDALRDLMKGFGRTVRTAFAALDPSRFGAEQLGNMLTLAVLTLALSRRAQLAPLVEGLSDEACGGLMAVLTPPDRGTSPHVTADEQRADLELTYARTVFGSLLQELRPSA